eukprot:m.407470 g.407470  ORF g.407470 m.407470 type:complete len:412 (+) comp56505_c0_seq31:441-1676(+)
MLLLAAALTASAATLALIVALALCASRRSAHHSFAASNRKLFAAQLQTRAEVERVKPAVVFPELPSTEEVHTDVDSSSQHSVAEPIELMSAPSSAAADIATMEELLAPLREAVLPASYAEGIDEDLPPGFSLEIALDSLDQLLSSYKELSPQDLLAPGELDSLRVHISHDEEVAQSDSLDASTVQVEELQAEPQLSSGSSNIHGVSLSSMSQKSFSQRALNRRSYRAAASAGRRLSLEDIYATDSISSPPLATRPSMLLSPMQSSSGGGKSAVDQRKSDESTPSPVVTRSPTPQQSSPSPDADQGTPVLPLKQFSRAMTSPSGASSPSQIRGDVSPLRPGSREALFEAMKETQAVLARHGPVNEVQLSPNDLWKLIRGHEDGATSRYGSRLTPHRTTSLGQHEGSYIVAMF